MSSSDTIAHQTSQDNFNVCQCTQLYKFNLVHSTLCISLLAFHFMFFTQCITLYDIFSNIHITDFSKFGKSSLMLSSK